MSILPHRPEYKSAQNLKAKRAELMEVSRMSADLGNLLVLGFRGMPLNPELLEKNYDQFWKTVENDIDRFLDPKVKGSTRYDAREVVPYFIGDVEVSTEIELAKLAKNRFSQAREVVGVLSGSGVAPTIEVSRALEFINNVRGGYMNATPDLSDVVRAGNPRLRF